MPVLGRSGAPVYSQDYQGPRGGEEMSDPLHEREGRCKFWVTGIDDRTIYLEPVSHGSIENRAFWEATPSGKIKLTITTEAQHMFKLGQEFYVDFTPCPQKP